VNTENKMLGVAALLGCVALAFVRAGLKVIER
jgi:hypothetical protein